MSDPVFDLSNTIVEAFAKAMDSLTEVITAYGARSAEDFRDTLAYMTKDLGPSFNQANQELASAAQEATLRAYDVARMAGRRSGPYRSDMAGPNHRYAGNVLLSVLQDPGFVTAENGTIHFGNVTMLQGRAKQWQRLNFGAGAAGSGSLPPVQVMEGMAIGLEIDASRAFTIPDNLFSKGGRWIGGDYYPGGSLTAGQRKQGYFMKRKLTRGITAEHWLDAGLASIADGMLPSYTHVVKEAFDKMPGVIQSFSRRGRIQRQWRGRTGWVAGATIN